MLMNYLKTALRNLARHKGFSLINVLGLAIGIACSLLVALYVRDELGYDAFHRNADRIYRLAFKEDRAYKTVDFPMSSGGMAPAMIDEMPEVVNAVRFVRFFSKEVRLEDRRFIETRMFYADPSVFEVFSFPLVKGDPRTALAEPRTAVVTEALAKKYFGDKDPVGETLILENNLAFKITGVAKNVPANSHFHFDLLASLATRGGISDEWRPSSCYTYLLVRDGVRPVSLEAKIVELFARHKTPNDKRAFYLQPLREIHLRSHLERELEPNGDIAYVYILSAVAFFVLFIAGVNFMNLSTARSAGRAKEVGVRKVAGASRRALIRQFLGESVFLAFLACLLALLLIFLALPAFNGFAGKELGFGLLAKGPGPAVLFFVVLFIGLLAGSYPALFLSRFEPANVIKGGWRSGPRASAFRRFLVVFQFALSIMMISGTFLIRNQLDFIRNKNLGFDKENVIVCRVDNRGVQKATFALKNELLQNPGIVSVAAATAVPGLTVNPDSFRLEGEADFQMMGHVFGDEDFIASLGLELKEGRAFSGAFPSDAKEALIINETAARKFGEASAVGKTIEVAGLGKKTIVGVVGDFHQLSKYQKIDALAMSLLYENLYGNELIQFLLVKVRPERLRETIGFLKEEWAKVSGGRLLDYAFLDEDYDALYKKDERLEAVFASFTALAVFVACLGLFGLATFAAEKRTKEIGIRKILGASPSRLFLLLSKEFSVRILAANLIAWPAGYFLLKRWLQKFAYRTPISLETFFLAGGAAFALALLTISYQTAKAALADPVEALKYE